MHPTEFVRYLSLATIVAVLSLPSFVTADEKRVGPEELALLPPYCMYTQYFAGWVPGGNNKAQSERWRSRIGAAFSHIHHYCWGLAETNQATIFGFKYSRQVRSSLLNDSIQQFDYVLERAPPDFVLLPEILTKKGENLLLLGNAPLAIRELERAIELKPDYWPPYVRLSGHYKDAGGLEKARELLEKALSLSPKSKTLKRRLAELDAASDKRKPSRDQSNRRNPPSRDR